MNNDTNTIEKFVGELSHKIRNSKSDLFHTPDTWDELMDWVERHPPVQRPALYTAAGMAWNLALECMHEGLS